MKGSVVIRALVAVFACIAVCLLAVYYDRIFFGDFKGYVEVEHGVAHFERGAPAIEIVLRAASPLLAILGVAAYVGRIVLTKKVWKGASASVCVALSMLVALSIEVARSMDLGYIPRAGTIAAWIAVSLSLGAASAWIAAVWWPNKSLERTRDE